jgi:hypothetical protein
MYTLISGQAAPISKLAAVYSWLHASHYITSYTINYQILDILVSIPIRRPDDYKGESPIGTYLDVTEPQPPRREGAWHIAQWK